MSWKDDLRKDLRASADDARDVARAKREADAAARRAVEEAHAQAVAVLAEAQQELSTLLPQGSVERSYGGENYLKIQNRKLVVARTADGVLTVNLDGKETRFVLDITKHWMVLEMSPEKRADVEDFVGQRVREMAKAARR